MTLSLITPDRCWKFLILNQDHRNTGLRAAAREAPGDERKPSGFSLIRRVEDRPLEGAREQDAVGPVGAGGASGQKVVRPVTGVRDQLPLRDGGTVQPVPDRKGAERPPGALSVGD